MPKMMLAAPPPQQPSKLRGAVDKVVHANRGAKMFNDGKHGEAWATRMMAEQELMQLEGDSGPSYSPAVSASSTFVQVLVEQATGVRTLSGDGWQALTHTHILTHAHAHQVMVEQATGVRTLSNAHPGPPTVTCQLRLTINGEAVGGRRATGAPPPGSDPVWNEQFAMRVSDPQHSQLELTLWDVTLSPRRSAENLLGEVVVNLNKLEAHQGDIIEHEFDVKCQDPTAPDGSGLASNGVLFLILRLVQWSGAVNELHPAALKSVVTDMADFGGEDPPPPPPPPPTRANAPARQSIHAPVLAPALGMNAALSLPDVRNLAGAAADTPAVLDQPRQPRPSQEAADTAEGRQAGGNDNARDDAQGKLAKEEGPGRKRSSRKKQGGQGDVHADPAGWLQGETAVVAVAVLGACHIPFLTRLECLR